MNNLNNKVTIIIRSVGERTEQLCRELILAQGVTPDNVIIVREAPFSAAMRKSFEIGIERGLPWTFCVDADVLLRPNSIQKLLQLAEAQEENVCEVQGFVLDNFFGGPREAGNHLYRTKHLPIALACIPEEGVNIRPERHTLGVMQAKGFPFARIKEIVGLHDHEQYFQDIFRKSFVQAHKHLYRAEPMVTLWRDRAASDPDYRVALAGFAHGVMHHGPAVIDVNFKLYQSQYKELGLTEKEELPADSYSLLDIETIVNNWVEPEQYRRFFPTKLGLVSNEKKEIDQPETLNTRKRWQQIVEEIGLTKAIVYSTGAALAKGGDKIKRATGYQQK